VYWLRWIIAIILFLIAALFALVWFGDFLNVKSKTKKETDPPSWVWPLSTIITGMLGLLVLPVFHLTWTWPHGSTRILYAHPVRSIVSILLLWVTARWLIRLFQRQRRERGHVLGSMAVVVVCLISGWILYPREEQLATKPTAAETEKSKVSTPAQSKPTTTNTTSTPTNTTTSDLTNATSTEVNNTEHNNTPPDTSTTASNGKASDTKKSSSTDKSQNGKFIPGMNSADIVIDLENTWKLHFTREVNKNFLIHHGEVVDPDTGVRLVCDVWQQAPNEVAMVQFQVDGTGVVGLVSSSDVNDVAIGYLGLCATAPYDGDNAKKAKSWVVDQLGSSSKKTTQRHFGKALFRVMNTPYVKVLTIYAEKFGTADYN
jgi:type II secretory pathway pseudopilin PulG